jgi:hypothetical protein
VPTRRERVESGNRLVGGRLWIFSDRDNRLFHSSRFVSCAIRHSFSDLVSEFTTNKLTTHQIPGSPFDVGEFEARVMQDTGGQSVGPSAPSVRQLGADCNTLGHSNEKGGKIVATELMKRVDSR